MSDLKSKMPDINEITSMATKLFKDVKKSITEIIADYKANHPVSESTESAETTEAAHKDESSEIKKDKIEKNKPEVKDTDDSK